MDPKGQPQEKPTGSTLLDRLKSGAGNGSATAATTNIANAATSGRSVREVMMKQTTPNIRAEGASIERAATVVTDVVINGSATEVASKVATPKKTKASEVLFHCALRPNFGSVTADGTKFRFVNGYLKLDRDNANDAKVASFIESNAKAWGIVEENKK